MTDKEKNNCNCADHDHDENCECEERDNLITLEMDDGTLKDYVILDMLTHEGKNYIALAEVDSVEYDIMSYEEDGESMMLNVIEDDKEFNAVAMKFEELFESYEEESED